MKGYEDFPVSSVNWYGANEFCTYYGGSLPTEAQWEYAARGGIRSKKYLYAGGNDLDKISWNHSNSYKKKHNVATKKSNEIGLYDMTGSVLEWCQDWYNAEYYQNIELLTNPVNTYKNSSRVCRSSSWNFVGNGFHRITQRHETKPDMFAPNIGFRMVFSYK
ncbi:formylglycine-generating enzyme family protein [Bernardetia sp. OM2101]|uniref:formylglycine-generating enzyme family protein n=1 Tax=Bernardetia sp. OM2101 TaxID=3344876 RepID=UPI0035CF6BFC